MEKPHFKIKAHVDDPALTLLVADRLGAVVAQQCTLIDTYFDVDSDGGRMKLREFKGFSAGPDVENAAQFGIDPILAEPPAALIFYRRATDSQQTWADIYQSLPVPDAAELKTLLVAMFSPLRIITVRRRTFHFYDVSIHFDDVKGLGEFLQIVPQQKRDTTLEAAHQTAESVATALGVSHADRTTRSYIDLALGKGV